MNLRDAQSLEDVMKMTPEEVAEEHAKLEAIGKAALEVARRRATEIVGTEGEPDDIEADVAAITMGGLVQAIVELHADLPPAAVLELGQLACDALKQQIFGLARKKVNDGEELA